MTRGVTWAVGFAVVLLAAGAAAQPKVPDERVPFHDYNDILALFQRLGYTKEAWQAGIREVPPVYVAEVPEQWRDRTSKLIPVAGKKALFFRLLAPIVMKVNEVILADRTRAEEITKRLSLGESVSAEDQAWLAALAVRYKLIGSPGGQLHPDQYPELLLRVDIVPVSLSLAQAASESGWGTSRFAAEGNSLFGQWSWGKGLKPAEQRTESLGDQRVAAFGSTGEAAFAYALNLNTQNAYRDLRLERAGLRQHNQPISGAALVKTLTRYSERGQAYVDDLTKLMSQNQLAATDEAHLAKRPIIRLVFVGNNSK